MKDLNHLLAQNRAWASRLKDHDPSFFRQLSHQQTPGYLWIGCSDSRVPSTQLVDLPPGEMFVHRNVANVVVHTDLNCLSVIQFAVEVLRVRHIIVCGHYGCGGVQAAFSNSKLGLIDNWLRHVQDVKQKHESLLAKIDGEDGRVRRLCELNVVEQVVNVSRTTIVEQAWAGGQKLTVNGWIYGLDDGLVHDLRIEVADSNDVERSYQEALAAMQVT